MRTLLLASASMLLLGGTAMAQNSASPLSTSASHTSSANARTSMAPRLPGATGDNSGEAYLTRAEAALRRGHTGEAQEMLERAETRFLDRVTTASTASMPDTDPRITDIEQARQALGRGDRKAAMQSIQAAMSAAPPASSATMDMPNSTMPNSTMPNATMPGMGTTGAAATMAPPAGVPTPNQSPSVPPNSLGGIANGVGSAGGTGATAQTNHPMPAYTGPNSGTGQQPNTNPGP